MKIFYTLILALAFNLCRAQAPVPYINAAWQPTTFDNIKDNLSGLIGIKFAYERTVVINDPATAYLYYKAANGDKSKITVSINKGYTAVVNEVAIDGDLADIFPVYNKLFNKPATIDEIRKAGHDAFNIKQGNKVYTVSLVQDGKNWELDIRVI